PSDDPLPLMLAEPRQLGDVFQLIGVHLSQARRASPVRNFRARFPWLLANIAGGIAAWATELDPAVPTY
ncbi:MAG TPA: hypothetical protein PLB25_14835, partial [Rhodoferax sp.]|nr:hypothetical protein [Rhodoferax sp.]